MPKALARSCLVLALALASTAGPAGADDWSLTRERPTRPARRPARPAPRAPRAAPADRFLEAALNDPSSDLLVDHLVSRRRRADGGLDALRAELRARGTAPAKALLARLDAEEGALDAARAALEQLVREAPSSPVAAKTLAAIERRHGELARVAGWLEIALERTVDAASKEVLLREKMALHLDRGELGEAEASVAALFALRPRDVSLRLEWARELARRERAAEAARAFEAALAMARGDARIATPARVELARARLSAGDAEGALREVDRAARAPLASSFRAALLELEVAAHRELGSLDALARSLASRRDADSVVARAHVLDELGDDDGALEAYRLALRKRPRDRDLRTALARLYARLGRLEDVVTEYRRLVRDSAGDPIFVRELALLYDRMGRRPEAERLLDDLVRRHPRSGGVARVNAEIRERFGDREALREALAHWKRADPADPEPRVALGAELLAGGDRAGAVRELTTLLDLPGDPVETRLMVARALADHDLLEEADEVALPLAARAERELEVARALASISERPRAGERAEDRSARNRHAEALWMRVLAHPEADEEARREARRHVVHLARLEGTLDAKIEALERIVAGDPDELEAARLLAEAYLARDPERPERALAVLEALSERTRDAGVLVQLVRVKRKAGDREGELALLERLVTLDPRGSNLHLDRLVELSLELYRDDDALRFATEAARRAPHDAEAQRRLGALHRERRAMDEAIAAYRRAVALDDAHVPTLTALAALELARGRLDESLELQLRIVRVSPDDEAVRAAGQAALRLATTRARLEVVEGALAPLAVAYGARPVFRRLLLPVIEAEVAAGVLREPLSRRSAKVLVETLFEGDAGSKRRALALLAALRPEAAARPLMAFAATDAEGSLRADALVARAALEAKMDVAALAPLLRDPDRRVRLAAAWAAHRGGNDAMRLGLLESEDPLVRALASLSFAERPSPRAESALVARFLEDVNPEVRAAAGLALGRLGGPANLSHLSKVALAAPARERRAALVALAGAATSEAREALAAGFFDDSPLIRRAAQSAARAEGPPRVVMRSEGQPRVTELLELFLEPAWDLRASLEPLVPVLAEAARAMMAGPVERKLSTLRVLGGRESLDAAAMDALAAALAEDVSSLLRDPDARVRREAAALLVTLTGEQAERALSEALVDEEEVARTALDRLDVPLTEEARALVETAAESAGTWSLRRAAVALLGRKQPVRSRELLERVLRDDSHAIVRAEAASALAGLGDASAALERAASGDESRAVRRAASLALARTFD